MKRLFLIILILNFPLELVRLLSSAGQEFSIFNSASAQRTPLEKYEIAPASFEHVYIDHVRLNPSRTVTIGDNQYLGQVNRDHQFYGYGMFVNGDGSTITGKFRDSELLFGITMTQTAAVVGNIKNHASYSLTNGRLEYITVNGEQRKIDPRETLDYGFVSMKYDNGDQYVGEVYQRKRHGFGIYYYRNGDSWFGEYDNDIRSGFGVLFTVEGTLHIGEWKGEDEVRVIQIKKRK